MTAAIANAVAFPHLTPTNAIGWLKAVGLLRLSGAVGYWANDCFHLEIDSTESLVEKLLQYQPKPFASPWNGKSIFSNTKELEIVLASKAQRYALMREGYQELQGVLQPLDTKGLSSDKKKLLMMPLITSKVSNSYLLEWIDAVGLLTQTKQEAEFHKNDLLGTGGNVGTTDFCTVYFQACSKLWDLETGEPSIEAKAFIRAAVLGKVLPETLVLKGLLGHIYPAADYFDDLAPSDKSLEDYINNQGRSSQLANPIDLILYLEGATTFTGSSIPRNEIQNEGDQEHTLASYPLLLEVNSGTADTSDRTGRAYEIWLPLWSKPRDWKVFQKRVTTYLSFRLKNQVVDTTDMLNELTKRSESLGFSRFTRFGLWKRKGQGNYLVYIGLATPLKSDYGAELGEWRFRARPTKEQSQSQYNLLTALHKTLYQLQQGNAETATAIKLLGQIEILHSRIQAKIPPSPQLSEKWVEAVYKEYPIAEVELAAALASTSLTHKGTGRSFRPFRELLSSARYVPKSGTRFWSHDHKYRLKTASLEALCLSLLQLWSTDKEYHPSFGWTHWASPDAIAAFIAGRTNDQLILDLALGFALCKSPTKLARHSSTQPLPELYKYAASLQWCRDVALTAQTVNGLLTGSTVPLSRQLAAVQKPVVLPEHIAIGKRCALALVFPCQPFYQFGEVNA
ncbi:MULTISPECIES: type I-U CRISPR-associated protein Csx17 [Trichocoleus]|uniref:Type I-U CRISPR-associated protein Csx17 n=1 Tax=Trichocoleus desertorum GB2-A4 TaxID=2933944 RepID=A0ABV0JEU2_9CYAN|nr:type I-U CRISPR-associated protein Csx17 [Trichocoleus sp. FACHB-46]MBD1864248.1 type I-U CRISPR-associated protein Csx17 [Trichocoleus sp. FACHB-46]